MKLRDGLWLSKTSGTWHYHVKRGGRPLKGDTGCSTHQVAKEWLKAFLEVRARRAVGMAVPAPTLAQLVKEWLQVHGGFSRAHRANIELRFRLHMQSLSRTPVDQLTTADVLTMRTNYLASGKARADHHPRTSGGANNLVRTLDLLMGFAIRQGYIERKPYRVEPLKVQRKVRHVVTAAAFTAFLAEVDQARNLQVGVAVRLQLGLGLREREALRLRWEGVDFSRGTITPTDSKTGDAPPLDAPRWLLDVLEALPGDHAAGWVLPRRVKGKDGKVRLEPHCAAFTFKAVRRAGAALGLVLTPHRLRASFATLHKDLGTPTPTIQAMLRHGELRTTERYLEHQVAGAAEAQKKLARKLGMPHGSPAVPRLKRKAS